MPGFFQNAIDQEAGLGVRVWGLLAGVALLVACASSDDASPATTDAITTTSASAATTTTAAAATTAGPPGLVVSPSSAAFACAWPEDGPHSITVEGAEREYVTFRPPEVDEGPVPAVVLFHGFASSAAAFAGTSGLQAAAPAGGALLIAPQGLGDPAGWEIPNWVNDATFVNAVLDQVAATGCLDAGRVWVVGHSAGSAFAAFYGCNNVDRVAGIWLNAGLPPPLCTDRSPAVVISHGSADPVVPYGGGDQSTGSSTVVLKAVPEAANDWGATAGCLTVEGPADTGIGIRDWRRCDRGSFVRLYTIEGGGHTWPGAPGATGPGETTTLLDASCVLVALANEASPEPPSDVAC
jgi:polyhydroxybutyrate depolymerase